MTLPDAVLRELEAHSIRRIKVPTPFRIPMVNVYLIEDDPLTLVDAGPNSATAFDALEFGLRDLGVTFADVGLVLLTHQHMDHVGLAGAIARRGAASFGAIDVLGTYLDDYAASAAADDDVRERTMLEHGVEAPLVSMLRSLSSVTRQWGGSVSVDRRFAHNDVIELRDRRLHVLRRPGHSASDTMFVDDAAGIAFGGDHLLEGISTNALVDRPLDPDAPPGRTRPLLDYRRSLAETRSLDLKLILGGHGPVVTDHRRLIDERLRHHEDRALKLLDLLRQRPANARELALALWGDVAETQPFLTLSSALGHLDLLEADGRVTVMQRDGRTWFEAIA